jgi:hypothetical protein
VWGSIDIWPSRHGVTRYRLVVFPPGISKTERRWLRLWRAWPIWGALLWLASEIWLAQVLTPFEAISASTVVAVAAGAITALLAGDPRGQVRTLHLSMIAGFTDPMLTVRYTVLEMLVRVLTAADALHDLGRLATVDHEAVWWYAYDELAKQSDRSEQTASK